MWWICTWSWMWEIVCSQRCWRIGFIFTQIRLLFLDDIWICICPQLKTSAILRLLCEGFLFAYSITSTLRFNNNSFLAAMFTSPCNVHENILCMFNLHVVATTGDWSSGVLVCAQKGVWARDYTGVSVCLRLGASLTCLKMASEIVQDGESFQLESFVRGHHVYHTSWTPSFGVKYCLWKENS